MIIKKKINLILNFFRLQDELEEMKSRQEAHASDLSRENATREVELEKLRENESNLKADLAQRKQDLERLVILHLEKAGSIIQL